MNIISMAHNKEVQKLAVEYCKIGYTPEEVRESV